jgi:hypothetical protein
MFEITRIDGASAVFQIGVGHDKWKQLGNQLRILFPQLDGLVLDQSAASRTNPSPST